MWNLFKYFDVNDSGYITVENLKEATAREGRRLQQAEIETMIAEIDKNKDGMIDYEDFKAMMQDDIEEAPVPEVRIDEKTGKRKTVICHPASPTKI